MILHRVGDFSECTCASSRTDPAALIFMWPKWKVKLSNLTKVFVITSGKVRIQTPDCLTPMSVLKTPKALTKPNQTLLSELIFDCVCNK